MLYVNKLDDKKYERADDILQFVDDTAIACHAKDKHK